MFREGRTKAVGVVVERLSTSISSKNKDENSEWGQGSSSSKNRSRHGGANSAKSGEGSSAQ